MTCSLVDSSKARTQNQASVSQASFPTAGDGKANDGAD